MFHIFTRCEENLVTDQFIFHDHTQMSGSILEGRELFDAGASCPVVRKVAHYRKLKETCIISFTFFAAKDFLDTRNDSCHKERETGTRSISKYSI